MMATARKSVAVTPHDTNALTQGPADALFVGTGGDVVYRSDDAAADTTQTVPDGGHILCRVSHVRNTGTTATGIVAYYL
jgi:hypothetical protein